MTTEELKNAKSLREAVGDTIYAEMFQAALDETIDALCTRLAEAEDLLREWMKETAEIQLPEMAELCAQHTHAFLEGSTK